MKDPTSFALDLLPVHGFSCAGGYGNFSGRVQGPGSFNKLGGGTQTLSGSDANTHTGLTTVKDGILLLTKSVGVNAVGGNVQVGDGVGIAGSAVLGQVNHQACRPSR